MMLGVTLRWSSNGRSGWVHVCGATRCGSN
jgi:hypothetical protein